ncbi:MAG: hypothetical protein ABIP39_02595 [Polyangiaceae bacterium]
MVLAQGCGGSTDDAGVTPSTDSGSEASTDDGSATDSAPSEAATDAGDPYCDALNAKATRCGAGVACTTAYCPQFDALYSAGGLLAEAQCLQLQGCDNVPAPGADKDYKECIAAKSPPPTVAVQKLAADVCAACAPGAADCLAGAFAAPDGGKRGFGAGIPQLSDSLIDEIDAKCIVASSDAGDGGACTPGEFDKCVAKVVRQRLMPAPAVCGDI